MQENSPLATYHHTVLEHREKINEALRFVLAHSDAPLNLETVAAHVHVSPFHFHRFFTSYVGEPLGEHIRKKRMKKAAYLIAAGHPVIDIARDSGYSSVSAFGKAFRQTFGIAPTYYKESGTLYRPILKNLLARKDSLLPLQARIVERPRLTAFFIRKDFSQDGIFFENINRAFSTCFDEWGNILREKNISKEVCERIGFIWNADGLTGPVSFCEAGIIFQNPNGINDIAGIRIERREIQQGRWAVITHKGPYSTLWQTWNRIFNQWIFTSGFTIRQEHSFEVYLNNSRNTAPEDLVTEIYIPVL